MFDLFIHPRLFLRSDTLNHKIAPILLDNVIEIVEHPIMKVSYLVDLADHIIRIEKDAIVHVIDAQSPVPKMKAVDAVFPAIVNQPVQWNCSIQTINGVMANVDVTKME